jgi:hypothetical protein
MRPASTLSRRGSLLIRLLLASVMFVTAGWLPLHLAAGEAHFLQTAAPPAVSAAVDSSDFDGVLRGEFGPMSNLEAPGAAAEQIKPLFLEFLNDHSEP